MRDGGVLRGVGRRGRGGVPRRVRGGGRGGGDRGGRGVATRRALARRGPLAAIAVIPIPVLVVGIDAIDARKKAAAGRV